VVLAPLKIPPAAGVAAGSFIRITRIRNKDGTPMIRFATKTAPRCATLALAMTLAALPPALARMRGNFDDADANHDGRVTLQEFMAYATRSLSAASGPRAQRFNHLDPQQQSALLQQRFNKADTGHKGYLDRGDWNGP
jgi:hypothetical protein